MERVKRQYRPSSERASTRLTSGRSERVLTLAERLKSSRHVVGGAVLGGGLDDAVVDKGANLDEELLRAGDGEVGLGELVVDKLEDLVGEKSDVGGTKLESLRDGEVSLAKG